MKSKLFNKIFISLICLTIVFTDTVLAESLDIINFKEYLLNNFKINIGYDEYEKYSLQRVNELEEAMNLLLDEHISNVMEYSEIKSQEIENSLIAYGDCVKENIINEFSEIRSNINSNIDTDSNTGSSSTMDTNSDNNTDSNNDNSGDIDNNNNNDDSGNIDIDISIDGSIDNNQNQVIEDIDNSNELE